MSGVAAAQAVLDAFEAYQQSRSNLAMVGTDVGFEEDCLDACVLAEAELHLRHNLKKMLHDDPKMADIRERQWNVRVRDQRRAQRDERIRQMIREVLAELPK